MTNAAQGLITTDFHNGAKSVATLKRRWIEEAIHVLLHFKTAVEDHRVISPFGPPNLTGIHKGS